MPIRGDAERLRRCQSWPVLGFPRSVRGLWGTVGPGTRDPCPGLRGDERPGVGGTSEKFGDKRDIFLVLYKKNKLRSIKEYIKY